MFCCPRLPKAVGIHELLPVLHCKISKEFGVFADTLDNIPMVGTPPFKAAKSTLPSLKLYSIFLLVEFVLIVKASPAPLVVLVDWNP